MAHRQACSGTRSLSEPVSSALRTFAMVFSSMAVCVCSQGQPSLAGSGVLLFWARRGERGRRYGTRRRRCDLLAHVLAVTQPHVSTPPPHHHVVYHRIRASVAGRQVRIVCWSHRFGSYSVHRSHRDKWVITANTSHSTHLYTPCTHVRQ